MNAPSTSKKLPNVDILVMYTRHAIGSATNWRRGNKVADVKKELALTCAADEPASLHVVDLDDYG